MLLGTNQSTKECGIITSMNDSGIFTVLGGKRVLAVGGLILALSLHILIYLS